MNIWYVHKWHHGDYRGCIRVPVSFDKADKFAARLARRYGGFGWSYEVTDSQREPTPEFVDAGACI